MMIRLFFSTIVLVLLSACNGEDEALPVLPTSLDTPEAGLEEAGLKVDSYQLPLPPR